jgi:hypothetical protein
LQQHFERDAFVRRTRRERIAAREIEDRDARAIGSTKGTFDTLDGDACEVSDALPESGQRIEECRFSGVGVADNGNTQLVQSAAPRISDRR